MNPEVKRIGIGSALVGSTAALAWAVPEIAAVFGGNVVVAVVLSAVPTLIAYLTNTQKKYERGGK